jgi:hypothetical protein
MASLYDAGDCLEGCEQGFSLGLKKVHLISLMMIMTTTFSVDKFGTAVCIHTFGTGKICGKRPDKT